MEMIQVSGYVAEEKMAIAKVSGYKGLWLAGLNLEGDFNFLSLSNIALMQQTSFSKTNCKIGMQAQ